MGDEAPGADRTQVSSHPCPNCSAPISATLLPDVAVTCGACGHEFALADPLDYWDEGQWDEGLGGDPAARVARSREGPEPRRPPPMYGHELTTLRRVFHLGGRSRHNL
jgi:hypothetical protein